MIYAKLVKRLRSWAKDIQEGSTAIYAMDLDLKNAASSIEALTEQLEAARADTKKAVEALREIADAFGCECGDAARATLEEIEGEKG
jgi:hypothetical protein